MTARPLLLELQNLEQSREALDSQLVDLVLAAFENDETVEIEASLHVLQHTLEFAALDRDRRYRRRPFFREVVGFRALKRIAP